jgi:NDP-4-keto-2,6-dideoxyhexose 3-C-methyltransferase
LKKDAVREVSKCRVCGTSQLTPILSLGNQFVSDFVSSDGSSPQAPLDLVRCPACGLVQLRHTFSRDSLYRHYWYKSGISSTMRKALSDLVARTCEIANPGPNDVVIDIGCNDGTLLRSYPSPAPVRIGFEPAENLVVEARKGTDHIFNNYFSGDLFTQKFPSRKAKIVSSVAMFYDLEDPNRFVSDVIQVLAPDGVWVVQQNYLATMLERNGYDNIGHEHLEYYTLETMQSLLARHNLQVFEVETNDVNGGSFRTFISRAGTFPIGRSVAQMRSYESHLGLGKEKAYRDFAQKIAQLSSSVHEFVSNEVKNGKTVYVYGASNRGNTILQYCKLDHQLIRKATDANPEKWGRKTAGTLIPIVSKEEARRDRPDYFLILPHHFLAEIKRDERPFLEAGGKFIVPLPELQIVSS